MDISLVRILGNFQCCSRGMYLEAQAVSEAWLEAKARPRQLDSHPRQGKTEARQRSRNQDKADYTPRHQPHYRPNTSPFLTMNFHDFWATVCKTVRPMLSLSLIHI